MLDEIVAFFNVSATSRGRCVALIAPAGLGKSWLLDRLREGCTMQGIDIEIIDDVDMADDAAAIEARLLALAASRANVVVAARELPAAVRVVLDRRFDRRLIELPAYGRDEARQVLGSVGVHPWSCRTGALLDITASSTGIAARDLIDAAFSARIEVLVGDDAEAATWGNEGALMLEWFQAWTSCNDDAMAEVVSRARAGAESNDAASLVVMTEYFIGEGQFEFAVQYGERATQHADPTSVLARWGATSAACIRGMRGETIGVQSLHALAAHAQSMGDHLIEVQCAHRLAIVHSSRGELELAALAAHRGIEVADRARLHLRGLTLRTTLAIVDRFRGAEDASVALLTDVIDASRAGGSKYQFCNATASAEYADILLARGDIATARVLAEDALVRLPATGMVLARTGLKLVLARARALGNDVAGALEALGSPAEVLDAAEHAGQEYYVALEAVRILAVAGRDPRELDAWVEAIAAYTEGIGGDVAAALDEARAWQALLRGDILTASHRIARARQRWLEAGCECELIFSDSLVASVGGSSSTISAVTTTRTVVASTSRAGDKPIRDAGLAPGNLQPK
ncbi:MAG: hypothetical protein H7123_07225 [Thermoleophilia bacterium]|nr:hypothetical protein [Thermoleophilia bacterium]